MAAAAEVDEVPATAPAALAASALSTGHKEVEEPASVASSHRQLMQRASEGNAPQVYGSRVPGDQQTAAQDSLLNSPHKVEASETAAPNSTAEMLQQPAGAFHSEFLNSFPILDPTVLSHTLWHGELIPDSLQCVIVFWPLNLSAIGMRTLVFISCTLSSCRIRYSFDHVVLIALLCDQADPLYDLQSHQLYSGPSLCHLHPPLLRPLR